MCNETGGGENELTPEQQSLVDRSKAGETLTTREQSSLPTKEATEARMRELMPTRFGGR